jgi:hypothetical protein
VGEGCRVQVGEWAVAESSRRRWKVMGEKGKSDLNRSRGSLSRMCLIAHIVRSIILMQDCEFVR